MAPSLSRLLLGAASTLTDEVMPHIAEDAPFAVEHLGAIGLILACIAQEAERAADTAVGEQDALRALFAEAAAAPLPPDLRKRLAEAAADDAITSLKAPDLDAKTAELKLLLMELMEATEAERFDWAEKLEARIWVVLKAGAERRALYLPVL